MSMDFNIKPVGAPVAVPVAPPVSEAANHAVATQLPAPQSVTVVDASARAHVDSGIANPSVSHQVVIDRAAASIVYQVVDEKTSLVVRQFPEEAILRRRAYFHSLDMTRGEPSRPIATDRKA
ncbi:MAG: hypothetical protein Q7U92_23015 [Bradyrhizobium sp.]|nr:hypothetical protein [Bradyrhizobium sp.]